MKKFYMTMVAMLCGVAAMAQENTLYVNEFSVKPGEDGVIAVCLRNADPVCSVSFELNNLPEGITITDDDSELTFNEERINLDWVREVVGKPTWAANKFYQFSADLDGSTKNQIVFGPTAKASGRGTKDAWEGTSFVGNDGELIYIPVSVAATVAEQPYTLTISKINCTNTEFKPTGIANPTTTTFVLNVGEGTGIHSINADDVNAPVYNVAGQRVSKAQKGVYIQNGKKVAVK
jgi:hypothetical protein